MDKQKIFTIIACFYRFTNYLMLLRTLRTINLLVVFFTLFCFTLTGRTSKIDSLENRLNNYKTRDTTRVNILNEVAYEAYFSDKEKTRVYAEESFKLAKELGFEKGRAESLWLLGIANMGVDPNGSLAFFQNALDIAERNKYKQGEGKYTNAIGTVFGVTGRDSLAIVYYRKAIEIAKELNDPHELGKYFINISQAHNRMGKVEKALEGYNEALRVLLKAGDKNGAAICYNSMGNIYTTQGNYPIALECLHNGLKIREEMRETSAVSKSLVSIGSIYFTQKNYEKALEYNQKVIEIAGNAGDKHTLAGGLLNIGLIYMQTNNEQAMEYLQKALVISKDLKILPLQINILLNTGLFYYKHSEKQKALEFYQEALSLSEENGMKSSESLAKLQIAIIYYDQKEFSRALDYARSSLEIAKNLKIIETEKDSHNLLAEIYAKTNNFKGAYIHNQLYKELSDKIFNENNVRKITELEYTYRFEKERQAIALEQSKKDEVQSAKRKQQYAIILTLSVSFILVSLLALYILRLYRFNKQANEALRRMETEKKRLLEQEIERINRELEDNQRSLTAASLKLIQNSERDAERVRMLESIIDTITPEGKRVVLAMISDFKRISRSSNWKEFELLFQKVHSSFYEKLNSNFPDLTANERKLCAFLKLNMSSKDIANITFQSEEALKKARQRLRQKLGIDRDTNLVSYLQNI